MEKKEITIAKKTDYFKELDVGKKYMLLTVYLILTVIFSDSYRRIAIKVKIYLDILFLFSITSLKEVN